jgi:hypothetical protein
MILTHESGSHEDQFDGKKGQKSRGTIPLRDSSMRFSTSGFFQQSNKPGPLIHFLKYL